MMKDIICLVALMIVCISAAVEVKNLAGPPTDFPSFVLPTPLHAADVQNSASFKVNLAPSNFDDAVLVQQLNLTVDSEHQFQFVFYSPNNESLTLSLKNPKGKSVLLKGKTTYFPIGSLEIPGTQYHIKKPARGVYTLTVQSKPLQPALYNLLLSNVVPDAYVMLWNEDSLATHTALNSYSLLTGQQVGLVSRVFTDSFTSSEMALGKAPTALQGSIETADMNVQLPNGLSIDKPMLDDGLHSDGVANDGVYGGLITATVAGQYIFSATITGTNDDGKQYVRTTQQLVTVVDPDLELTGSATGSLDATKTKLDIFLAATAPSGNKYKAYAEVWGTDSAGNEVAVAWVGGMSFVQNNGGMNSLTLQLDLNWVSMAEAQEPLILKNVVIQETANYIPISQFDVIPIKTDTALAPIMATQTLIKKNGKITQEMREGKRPERLSALNVNATTATIALVHGYCSSKNPFTVYPSDWSNAQFYLNPDQNFDHDEFALAVLDWVEPYGPFSYVGHSQGGAVGLHIKNFYWTGLDQVTGGRLLQSVGTPYQGSSGAGSAADLAKLFGVLCGANQDLSRDGAVLWLNGVTPENRALVYYYTTTYVQGKFFGDYCNLATNLVLDWPNDGVAEYDHSQLPGGQDQGNAEGWCHSVDMKYEAQCENRERNRLMNTVAARDIKQ